MKLDVVKKNKLLTTSLLMLLIPEIIFTPITSFIISVIKQSDKYIENNILMKSGNIYLFALFVFLVFIQSLGIIGLIITLFSLAKKEEKKSKKNTFYFLSFLSLLLLCFVIFIFFMLYVFANLSIGL